ncbi:hypothetical protein [Lentimicrobium saccharophilum]|nr:hypothetical protein [Lentimicrobium saccharophilum]
MKTIILTILIFLALLSSGQNQSTKKIELLKIISSKSLPDTELEYSVNGIVLRFSKSLSLKYLDSLQLRNFETTLDTSAFSKQDLENVALLIKSIREYLNSSGIIKLTVPLNFDIIVDKDANYSGAILGSVNSLHDDLICQMLDSGEFNIFSNGIKLHSITKAHVVEEDLGSRSETIRYYSENSKELKTCCPCYFLLSNSSKKK